MLSKIPRTVFVVSAMPPFVGGSVTLMYNLFLDIDTSESVVVTQSTMGFSPSASLGLDYSCSSNLKRVEIHGIPKIVCRGDRFGLPNSFMMFQVPLILKKTVRAAKRINAEVVMASWPFDHFAVAAWIAAKKLGLPFVIYLHDLWYETKRTYIERLLAAYFEKKVIKGANLVLVISSPTRMYLHRKYRLTNIKVLEHSVNSQIWRLDKILSRSKYRPRHIVMLGGVNKFNSDSVIAFSKALAMIPDIHLTILTNQGIEQLQSLGVECSRITSFFCPRDKLKQTILEADALYVALGFDTPVHEETKVVIPTRLMDYLPSGKPIIAHGPKYTWMIQEAQNRGWGYVIDSLDVDDIKASLEEFIGLPDYSALINGGLAEGKRRDYVNQSKLLAKYLEQAASSIESSGS